MDNSQGAVEVYPSIEDEEADVDVVSTSTIPSEVMECDGTQDAYSNILKNSEPYFLGTIFLSPASLIAPEARFMRRPVSGETLSLFIYLLVVLVKVR